MQTDSLVRIMAIFLVAQSVYFQPCALVATFLMPQDVGSVRLDFHALVDHIHQLQLLIIHPQLVPLATTYRAANVSVAVSPTLNVQVVMLLLQPIL